MDLSRDQFLLDCEDYGYYLDHYITNRDLRYVRQKGIIRQLVELSYRSEAPIYSREEFEKRKEFVEDIYRPKQEIHKLLGIFLRSDDPFLKALAEREKSNFQKTVSTIIFITYIRKGGKEETGYIDYEHSIRRANSVRANGFDWLGVFQGTRKLRPRSCDLSYCDWHNKRVFYNDSDNYHIITDAKYGVVFQYKGDLKKVYINDEKPPDKRNCVRTVIRSPIYGSVTLYDHIIRRKV